MHAASVSTAQFSTALPAMRSALRQLRYLSVGAQVGRFRRTAEMCQVDQSVVNRSLRRLLADSTIAHTLRTRSQRQRPSTDDESNRLSGQWELLN
jgi:hypothetical protein